MCLDRISFVQLLFDFEQLTFYNSCIVHVNDFSYCTHTHTYMNDSCLYLYTDFTQMILRVRRYKRECLVFGYKKCLYIKLFTKISSLTIYRVVYSYTSLLANIRRRWLGRVHVLYPVPPHFTFVSWGVRSCTCGWQFYLHANSKDRNMAGTDGSP